MQLTQQRSIDHFFSNVTWNKIEELEKLNEDSFDFELATHWRNPSIFLTLSLFIVTRVSDYVCILSWITCQVFSQYMHARHVGLVAMVMPSWHRTLFASIALSLASNDIHILEMRKNYLLVNFMAMSSI